jgi:hypothetical protein
LGLISTWQLPAVSTLAKLFEKPFFKATGPKEPQTCRGSSLEYLKIFKVFKACASFSERASLIFVLFWFSELQNNQNMTECYRILQITVTYCDYCETDAAYSEQARPGVVPGSGHGQGWTWAIHLELELFTSEVTKS